MKNVVTRKKAAKLRRRGKSNVFNFSDLMCNGLEIIDIQAGEAPIPLCLEGEKDDPVLMYWNDSVFMYWNFWRCFISALRKKLSEILTDEELRSTQDGMLFSLLFEYKTGFHFFSIHQEWVAQRLKVDPQTSFLAENSTEAFKALRFLCFKDGKENPLAQKFQMPTMALDLPKRCAVNLILASLAETAAKRK